MTKPIEEKEEIIFNVLCINGKTFPVTLTKKGIYYAKDDVTIPITSILKIIKNSRLPLLKGYSVKYDTVNIGCKFRILVSSLSSLAYLYKTHFE